MRRRNTGRAISTTTSVILIIIMITVGALSVVVYTTGMSGSQPRTVSNTAEGLVCPGVFGNSTAENLPFGIQAIVQTFVPLQGSGNIVWCIYEKSDGKLEAVYATNRILDGPTASSDESYVVTGSHQIAPGPAGEATNGALYFFDKEGQIKWTIPDLQFSVEINGNGSVIIANDPGLLYIDNGGAVLWNYSSFNSESVALVANGSEVVDGITGVAFPNDSNFGSDLVLFDSHGHALWNISIPNQMFDSTASLAVSNGHIATGLSYNGFNGTLYYYSLNGTLVWSRHVSSAILGVSFANKGSDIFTQENWGNVTFDDAGNVIRNQT